MEVIEDREESFDESLKKLIYVLAVKFKPVKFVGDAECGRFFQLAQKAWQEPLATSWC